MSRSNEPERRITVEMNIDEPALLGAALELLHTYARSSGMDDIWSVEGTLRVTFEGRPRTWQLNFFKDKVRAIHSAHVITDELTGGAYAFPESAGGTSEGGA